MDEETLKNSQDITQPESETPTVLGDPRFDPESLKILNEVIFRPITYVVQGTAAATAGTNTVVKINSSGSALSCATDSNALQTPAGSFGQAVSWSGSTIGAVIVASLAPVALTSVKTYKGLATASVKTTKGLAIASRKTKKGLA